MRPAGRASPPPATPSTRSPIFPGPGAPAATISIPGGCTSGSGWGLRPPRSRAAGAAPTSRTWSGGPPGAAGRAGDGGPRASSRPALLAEDALIFGLRMNEGVDLAPAGADVARRPVGRIRRAARPPGRRAASSGGTGSRVSLTVRGRLVADAVGAELMAAWRGAAQDLGLAAPAGRSGGPQRLNRLALEILQVGVPRHPLEIAVAEGHRALQGPQGVRLAPAERQAAGEIVVGGGLSGCSRTRRRSIRGRRRSARPWCTGRRESR